MLGASYQNGALQQLICSLQNPLLSDGTFLLKQVNVRKFKCFHLTRTGSSLKLDYVFNPNNLSACTNLYVNMKEAQARTTNDTIISSNRTIGTGQVCTTEDPGHQDQTIYNSTFYRVITN